MYLRCLYFVFSFLFRLPPRRLIVFTFLTGALALLTFLLDIALSSAIFQLLSALTTFEIIMMTSNISGIFSADISLEKLTCLIYSACLPSWRRILFNPMNRYPELWHLDRLVRACFVQISSSGVAFIHSNLFSTVRLLLTDIAPLTFGRLCALCAYIAFLCASNQSTDLWRACEEGAVALVSAVDLHQ